MRPALRHLRCLLPGVLLAVSGALAQVEDNVHTEYAQVLRVEPVRLPAPPPEHDDNCAPMLQIEPERTQQRRAGDTDAECIPLQPGQRNTEPLIVYDVDYVLRGVKYRSRLPYDPGNRLQVRLSVTPVLPAKNPGDPPTP